MDVQIRRVYEAPKRSRGDGVRVLVDRLWPRGMSKDRLQFDRWAKDVAPSNDLRVWYGHRPDRFETFARRFRDELRDPERANEIRELRKIASEGPLTLLTATKDVDRSAAAVIAAVISGRRRA